MRRVDHVLWVLALTACSQSPPPPSSAPAVTPSAASADTTQGRLVHITRFDCVDAAAEATDAGQFAWARGVSLWAGGGPGGAAWNIGGLHCAVELQLDCTRGDVDVELRVGGALANQQHTSIEGNGARIVTFDVTAEQWESHLDQATPLTERFPYRTATFSATATASCETPEAFGPGPGPRLEFADDRHFTAGFASGE